MQELEHLSATQRHTQQVPKYRALLRITGQVLDYAHPVVQKAGKMVREGQTLSSSLASTGIFPGLSVDMIEVGESTGALAAMLNSVAEFYEDDVNTKMTAVLSLIEPAIMIFMGIFVAFVLIALYLPIFSLADTIR